MEDIVSFIKEACNYENCQAKLEDVLSVFGNPKSGFKPCTIEDIVDTISDEFPIFDDDINVGAGQVKFTVKGRNAFTGVVSYDTNGGKKVTITNISVEA